MKHYSLYCLAFALLLVSCSPVYVPNTRNTPLFAKAGEFQGAMQYGTAGLDLQAAVSVTNNIALMGNYSYGNHNTDTLNNPDYQNYHKHKLYEGAIGYYRNDRDFCFEIFLGYGQGDATSRRSDYFFSSTSDFSAGKYTRIFFQPSFGLNKKVVNVAFTPRVSLVDFSEFSSSTTTKIDLEPKIFIEPAVTARFNFIDNRFFGTVQVGASIAPSGNALFDHQHFNVSTGFGFRLGGLRWSKASEDKEK